MREHYTYREENIEIITMITTQNVGKIMMMMMMMMTMMMMIIMIIINRYQDPITRSLQLS